MKHLLKVRRFGGILGKVWILFNNINLNAGDQRVRLHGEHGEGGGRRDPRAEGRLLRGEAGLDLEGAAVARRSRPRPRDEVERGGNQQGKDKETCDFQNHSINCGPSF